MRVDDLGGLSVGRNRRRRMARSGEAKNRASRDEGQLFRLPMIESRNWKRLMKFR